MSRLNRLVAHWPLVIAVAFAAFTLVLILSLYGAQSRLRAATDTRLIADSQRRAAAVADFIAERRQAVAELAASREVEAYLVNRALGMSPQYGLNVSLDAVEQLFNQHLRQKTLRGWPVYLHIAFYVEPGQPAAQAGVGVAGSEAVAALGKTPELQIDQKRWRITASAPVVQRDTVVGHVVTVSDLRLLSRLLISSDSPKGGEGKYLEVLITDDGFDIPGSGRSPFQFGDAGRLFAKLPQNQVMAAADVSGAAQFGHLLALRTAIAGSPLSMLTLTSEIDAYGQLASPTYVLWLSLFSVALVLAAFGFDRMRKQLVLFELKSAEAARHSAELQQRNQALSDEVARRQAAESEIAQLAFFDPLTGLPNRRLLVDRLTQALASRMRSPRQGALLFIDLDHFKTLNDTLGHGMGDLLLQQVAQRLLSCVREGDSVARLGGDEFVVMLDDLGTSQEEAANSTEKVGEKILNALKQPYQLAHTSHRSTASIGITLFGQDQLDVEDLLKRADLAMYRAKDQGRNTLRFYDPQMQAVVTASAALQADLAAAVANQQFDLVYQAQVDASRQVIGAEALLRWQRPKHGPVSPAEFIPAAEESGLIISIGQWVLATACAQLARWAKVPALAHLSLAVNVSARQFHHHEFVSQVLAALASTGANAHRLKLELTESLLVDDMEEVITKMTALKAYGIGFALDDFGTGYSSLAYLKRLPLDQLKIDKSFVLDVLTDPNDAAIAKTIITLAQSLGLGVIAEGVETEAQRHFLSQAGCQTYQGYYFSRPLPVAQFEAYAQQV
ncbi:EAL domain-containing protein [Rhodoferax sp. 4810]|nr:EAL domain-containing protein [Rhodoferax jenense]